MKSELFQHEIRKTSAVFGRNHAVDVVFKGNSAKTDGCTIILPSLDMNASITVEQQSIMRGYVDHEAGHVRHSDFTAITKLVVECQRTGNKLLRTLHNALEDVWLERRVMDEYRGSEANLRATTHAVNSAFLKQFPAGDKHLHDDMFVAAVACTWEGRKNYGGATCQQCLDLLNDDLRNVLPKWIAGLDTCRNSQDVIDLARIVERSIRSGDYKSQKPKETSQKGKGKPQSKTNDAKTNNAKTGDANIDDDSDKRDDENTAQKAHTIGQDQNGQDDAQAGQADADDTHNVVGESDTGSDTGDNVVYDDFDMSKIVDKMAKDTGLLNLSSKRSYHVFDSSADRWYVSGDGSNYGNYMENKPAKDYDDMVASMAGDVNVMRRKLERALTANLARDWDVGREQGRLDTRRLISAYSGRPNIFKIRKDKSEMDTALMILIDLSGSMAGNPAEVAQKCVIAIAEAIDRTGVKYEVIGFNNRRFVAIPASATRKEIKAIRKNYGRLLSLDMYVFKQFDTRLFAAKGALTTIPYFVNGRNTDGDALSYAYDRLCNRSEKRKVCMVFSDGFPADNSYAVQKLEMQQQRLRDVVSRIERDGVDCIGVGIESNAVQKFYSKWVVVNNVEDLSHHVMDQLSRTLLGERFQIDNTKLLQAHHAV